MFYYQRQEGHSTRGLNQWHAVKMHFDYSQLLMLILIVVAACVAPDFCFHFVGVFVWQVWWEQDVAIVGAVGCRVPLVHTAAIVHGKQVADDFLEELVSRLESNLCVSSHHGKNQTCKTHSVHWQ
eukprot:6438542-Amphidinium_carterae.2